MGRLITHNQQQAEELNRTRVKLNEYKKSQKGKEYIIKIDDKTSVSRYLEKKPTKQQIQEIKERYLQRMATAQTTKRW